MHVITTAWRKWNPLAVRSAPARPGENGTPWPSGVPPRLLLQPLLLEFNHHWRLHWPSFWFPRPNSNRQEALYPV